LLRLVRRDALDSKAPGCITAAAADVAQFEAQLAGFGRKRLQDLRRVLTPVAEVHGAPSGGCCPGQGCSDVVVAIRWFVAESCVPDACGFRVPIGVPIE
jgi:hypothetical protein